MIGDRQQDRHNAGMTGPRPRDPLVSVVIPTYNQAVYLPSAVTSVLEQDYPAIELIVVDDGSTDATPRILRDYGEAIVHAQQPNRGAANALNEGIRMARGDFVCWLSSDDAFLPGKIRRQVEAFREDADLAICFTGFVIMDAEGVDLHDRTHVTPIHPDLFVSVFWANPVNGSTVMMPRALFDEVGLFDESLRADVDGDMWLRVLKTRRARYLPGAFLRYRVHDAALSANKPLMRESKSRVRLARLRDGSLVARLRAVDPAAVAETLARMSGDFSRSGYPEVAQALLVASLRNGPAPTTQGRALGRVITTASAPRVRAASRATRGAIRAATRRAARLGRSVVRPR